MRVRRFGFLVPALLVVAIPVAGLPANDVELKQKPQQSRPARSYRDPFQPLVTARKDPPKEVVTAPPRPRPAGLSGMLVAEATVIGIASGPNTRLAILQGREKVSYFGKVGDKLYNGVISTIDLDKVVFSEDTAGGDGKQRRAVIKKLHAEVEPMANLGGNHAN